MSERARNYRWVIWLVALAAPFALIALVFAAFGRGPGTAPEYRHRSALAVESPAETPAALPADGWKAVTLPGYIPKSPVLPSSGWFRLELRVDSLDEPTWAVYSERPYSNLAVFVNGVAVGASGPMTRPIPIHRDPLMFTFPAALLRPGANTVEVRSLEADYLSRLDELAIGPLSKIAPAYEFARAFHADYERVSLVVLLVLALLFTALWLLRRHETAHGWFALGLFGWAAHIGINLVPRSPFMPEKLWPYMGSIAIGIFAITATIFVNRQTRQPQPRVERAMQMFGAFSALFILIDPWWLNVATRLYIPYVWMPGLLVIAIYGVTQLLIALKRRPDTDTRILLAAAWLLLVVAVHDLLIQTGIIEWRPMYMRYTVGFALCAVSAVLLLRFARAFDAAERARDELDERVREKSAELELNLGRMKDLERERALNAERERILQDMHDGMGGHLVQALAIATSREQLKPLEEPLRACLEELRLMVDSLDPVDGDLASVLGTLRQRVSRRLELAGVHMRWQVDDLPSMPELGPRAVLDVARVVQEAITNALKHSGCDRITVSARQIPSSEQIEIAIEDNGRGPAPHVEMGSAGGHGQASMRRRAESLGGALRIEAASPGVRVALLLPVANREAAAAQSHDRALTSHATLKQG